ncbi:HD-GYP domain-containing protein [Pelotomaculum propionicicum]|nr:HD-GYP domain-containing protein [Pelotomaculum propionicicum]
MEGTVRAIVALAEKRDPYAAGHQTRVSRLACAVAREMDLPGEQIEGIRVAGLLHDIGKVYIPTDILNKPTRLTDIEMMLIKTHPSVGSEILEIIPFNWPVAQIALQHHERLNGSGYPAGLSGSEILLEAKILAVADVVEAMSNHRPYRPALGKDKALEEICNNSGILYDSDAVDVCLRVFTKNDFKFT